MYVGHEGEIKEECPPRVDTIWDICRWRKGTFTPAVFSTSRVWGKRLADYSGGWQTSVKRGGGAGGDYLAVGL